MKIVGYVLATLMLLAAGFVHFAGARKTFDAAGQVKEVEELAKGAPEGEKLLAEVPSSGRLKAGAALSIAAAAAGLVVLIFTYFKKSVVMKVVGAALVTSTLAALVLPSMDVGELAGMAPRPQALLAGVLAAVGCLGAWLASRHAAR